MTTNLGERFVNAIAVKDAVALRALLAPDVNFRAVTPGKFWEGDDANAVVDDVILGKWFSTERSITAILRVDCGTLGTVQRPGVRSSVVRSAADAFEAWVEHRFQ
jgi:hypothetical protein